MTDKKTISSVEQCLLHSTEMNNDETEMLQNNIAYINVRANEFAKYHLG